MMYHSSQPSRLRNLGCRIGRWLMRTGVLATTVVWSATIASADEPIHLKIVGGLAGVSQYERLEKPFWDHRIETLSNGRIKAEIHPFDRSGLRGKFALISRKTNSRRRFAMPVALGRDSPAS